MLPYISISHVLQNEDAAARFCAELERYGFRCVRIDESVLSEEREEIIRESEALVILLSPESAESEACHADSRVSLWAGKETVGVQITVGDVGASPFGIKEPILCPYAETDTPDPKSLALYIHRLYAQRLCRYASCYVRERSHRAEDADVRVIRLAVEAWRGKGESQFALGCAYADGDSLPMQETEAAAWTARAAEQGMTDAVVRLGEMKLDGAGTERDPAEAMRLFTAAAEGGSLRGQFNQGICCLHGYGMMKDSELAIRCFAAAAKAGYAPAQYRLGKMYADGEGVPRDWRRAVHYLYLATSSDEDRPEGLYGTGIQGTPRCVSMRYMTERVSSLTPFAHRGSRGAGRYTYRRMGGYPENDRTAELDTSYDSARYNYTRGYMRHRWDVALAEGELGRLIERGCAECGIRPSPLGAVRWYRRAAVHGHSDAMLALGDLYRTGRGMPCDPEEGVFLYERASAFGNEKAHFAMGVCFERGIGVAHNADEAARRYETSARMGYAPAQNNLGGCYEYGIGVAEDHMAAAEWYGRAAAQELAEASCRLGVCYEAGRGVTRNPERAFHLYEDAARRGNAYAAYRLALCYDHGSPVSVQYARAAHLYERAAGAGVSDAAYATALCYLLGKGVKRDESRSFAYFRAASERGSVQGTYETGISCFEGRGTVLDRARALAYFSRTVELYRAADPRRHEGAIPRGGMTDVEAAAGASYLLGYCALYGVGNAPRSVAQAMMYFEDAARMGLGDAMTAIGDMYTYGLCDSRVLGNAPLFETATDAYLAAAKVHETNALLSIGDSYRSDAARAAGEGDARLATELLEKAWRAYAHAAEHGSPEAHLCMALCAYRGEGTRRDAATAKWFLTQAYEKATVDVDADGAIAGCAEAALWLGDMSLDETSATVWYERAVSYTTRTVGDAVQASSCSLGRRGHAVHRRYAIRERIEERRRRDENAASTALHRLAAMKATAGEGGAAAFGYLAAAVLDGHAGALDDWTRIHLNAASCRSAEEISAEESKKARRRARASSPAEEAGARYARSCEAYYGALAPVPVPFEVDAEVRGEELPPYVTAEVTETARADALGVLGDCFFYGAGVREDRRAAARCYARAAVGRFPKDAPARGIVTAQYSLGWCLLHGVGVEKDARAGVKWLTDASRYHAEACYLLGECYEQGIGVDAPSERDAIKYYRKALRLGCARAEARATRLEKTLS